MQVSFLLLAPISGFLFLYNRSLLTFVRTSGLRTWWSKLWGIRTSVGSGEWGVCMVGGEGALGCRIIEMLVSRAEGKRRRVEREMVRVALWEWWVKVRGKKCAGVMRRRGEWRRRLVVVWEWRGVVLERHRKGLALERLRSSRSAQHRSRVLAALHKWLRVSCLRRNRRRVYQRIRTRRRGMLVTQLFTTWLDLVFAGREAARRMEAEVVTEEKAKAWKFIVHEERERERVAWREEKQAWERHREMERAVWEREKEREREERESTWKEELQKTRVGWQDEMRRVQRVMEERREEEREEERRKWEEEGVRREEERERVRSRVHGLESRLVECGRKREEERRQEAEEREQVRIDMLTGMERQRREIAQERMGLLEEMAQARREREDEREREREKETERESRERARGREWEEEREREGERVSGRWGRRAVRERAMRCKLASLREWCHVVGLRRRREMLIERRHKRQEKSRLHRSCLLWILATNFVARLREQHSSSK